MAMARLTMRSLTAFARAICVLVVWVHDKGQVVVAVADVPRPGPAAPLVDVTLGLENDSASRRSARRHPWPALGAGAQARAPRSRRHGAPARACCGPRSHSPSESLRHRCSPRSRRPSALARRRALAPVELEEQAWAARVVELRVAVDRIHHDIVQQLDRCDRDTRLDRRDDRFTAPSKLAKEHTALDDRLGYAVQAKLDLGDDTKRALRPDKQARQVVAGGGFSRTPTGAYDASIGKHDGQPQHVLAHGAVAHGVGARSARRRHAAERGVGARVDRERTSRSRAGAG